MSQRVIVAQTSCIIAVLLKQCFCLLKRIIDLHSMHIDANNPGQRGMFFIQAVVQPLRSYYYDYDYNHNPDMYID